MLATSELTGPAFAGDAARKMMNDPAIRASATVPGGEAGNEMTRMIASEAPEGGRYHLLSSAIMRMGEGVDGGDTIASMFGLSRETARKKLDLLTRVNDLTLLMDGKIRASSIGQGGMVGTGNPDSTLLNLSPGIRQDLLRASMSLEEFPVLFNYILSRSVLGLYPSEPSGMARIFRVNESVRDFKEQNIFKMQGMMARFAKIGRTEDYPERHSDLTEYAYRVEKYGCKVSLSWEDLVNDDLGVFSDIPARLIQGGIQTEQFFMTELLAVTTGWLSTFFTVANGGAAVGTSPLTIDNLATAITTMMKYKDSKDNRPIVARPAFLVVGPALLPAASAILRSVNVQNNNTSPANLPTVSPLGDFSLTLIVNPWIPQVVTSGSIADTMWGIFTNPSNIPVGELGFLRGFRAPVVMTQIPDSAGGAMMGQFADDSFHWKSALVMGGTRMDARAAYVSNGQ